MNEQREEKIEEQIRQLAAKFIQKESNGTSLITVTRVGSEQHLKKATVFVTILPETAEDNALNFLKRKRTEFREYVKKNSRFKNTPLFEFAIDLGEKHRQHIDEITQK